MDASKYFLDFQTFLKIFLRLWHLFTKVKVVDFPEKEFFPFIERQETIWDKKWEKVEYSELFLTLPFMSSTMSQMRSELKHFVSPLELLISAWGWSVCYYVTYTHTIFRAFLKVNSDKEFFVEQRKAAGIQNATLQQIVEHIFPDNRHVGSCNT